MTTRKIFGMGLSCVVLTLFGCEKASSVPKNAPGSGETSKAQNSQSKTNVPSGWITFSPPEKDFSVLVPGSPKIDRNRNTDLQKERIFIFPKGDSSLAIYFFTNRKGSAAKIDDIQEARTNPNLVPGSLREITLGKLKGIEVLEKDPKGNEETLARIFRSSDGTEALSLSVKNTKGFSENEIRAFLDSFKFN